MVDSCTSCGSIDAEAVSHKLAHIPTHQAVSEYLDTNIALPETEISRIRVSSEVMHSWLNPLDAKIEELQRLRNHVQHQVQRHAAALAPIRRLPDDVLREIMSALPHEFNSFYHLTTMDVRAGMWPVAQVSRHWRTIAVSTPALWSIVQVCPLGRDNTFPPQSAEILEEQLSRAAGVTLSVTFRAGSERLHSLVQDDSPSVHDRLIDLLFAHSAVWNRLVFFLEALDTYNMRFIGRLSEKSLTVPNLKTIIWDDPLSLLVTADLAGLPALRGLRSVFVRFNTLSNTFLLGLPFTQLRHLRFGAPLDHTVRSILESTPNLLSCHLSTFISLDVAPTPKVIRLPNLRHLACTAVDLVVFQVPSLTNLFVALSDSTTSHFARFLDKHPKSLLLSLGLRVTDIDVRSFALLIRTLKQHRAVQRFSLDWQKDLGERMATLSALKPLLSKEDPAAIFPRLRHFLLTYHNPHDINLLPNLLSIAAHRMETQGKRTTATIRLQMRDTSVLNVEPGLRAELDALEEKGLDIFIQVLNTTKKELPAWYGLRGK